MAAPFGFSAGDFIAALHVLNKAVSALRDSDGASSHFKHTILELEGLAFVLQRVQALQSADTASQSLQKLHFLSHQCYIPLDTFLNNIRKLIPDLGDEKLDGQRSKWQEGVKRPARQVQWALQLQKHLCALKAAITPQLEAIQILLQLINLEQQSMLQESQNKFAEAALGLAATIQSKSDALDSRLEYLSTEASMNVAIRSLENLRLEISGMNARVMSGLADLRVNQGCRHNSLNSGIQFAGSKHTNDQRERPVQCDAGYATPTAGPLVARHSTKLITMDTTIGDIVQLLRDGVNALLLRLWIFLSIFQTVRHNLKIIARLPTMLLSSNILFEDALGRQVSLPYEHFKHFPVFLARLECEFRNMPGYHCLSRNDFHLFREEADIEAPYFQITEEEEWDGIVKPGFKLKMSVTFQNVGDDELWSSDDPCPRCKASPKFKRACDTVQYCKSCGFSYFYQNFDRWRHDLPSVRSVGPQFERNFGEQLGLADKAYIGAFKNVHVVKTCVFPDCRRQNLLKWKFDVKGHAMCDDCYNRKISVRAPFKTLIWLGGRRLFSSSGKRI